MKSNYYKAYFVDADGRKISYYIDNDGNVKLYFVNGDRKDIEGSSHILIAEAMLEENEDLRKEYEESGVFSKIDFLIQKGYMKISESDYDGNRIIYDRPKISKKQEEMLTTFLARRI